MAARKVYSTLLMSGASITGLPTPTGPTDAAPRSFVDAAVASLRDWVVAQLSTKAANNDSRLSDARTPVAHRHPLGDLVTTGTPSATNFLRGDGSWAVAVDPSALLKVKRTEIDFGVKPTAYGRFTITDPDLTATSRVLVEQAGEGVPEATATGLLQTVSPARAADEAEMDPMELIAFPAAGSLTITARTLDGPVVGRYVVYYLIG